MSNYIHGSEPEEQARLAKLNQLINSRCLSLLEIRGGEHILDVGSGLGQFTLAMAAKAGEIGMCLGIERDKNQLKIAQQNLEDLDGVACFRGHRRLRQPCLRAAPPWPSPQPHFRAAVRVPK